MTPAQCVRTCLLGAFIAACAGLILRTILALAGKRVPWFTEIALAAGAALLSLVCRFVHERLVLKDYDKMVEQRRRRMHW
ncbi:hypothetical protein FJY63_13800 [Candidatus Sumerlaeota bacterium]|nr:hypothetical protein [Candidatus Sumerlaeota bacterium]